jgi:hypothetical protein
MINRARGDNPTVRWRKVDGGVVETMNQQGFREVVHNPSLVQHTGLDSTIKLGHRGRPPRTALTYPGDGFDALTLLPGNSAQAAGST